MATNVRIIRPATHADWLKERERGIGSSEVGTILGCNPFETAYALWRRKRGLDAPIAENAAMRAGHMLEGVVAAYFEEETGRKVIKSSAGDWLAVDPERPYLRVSPDRTFWLGKSRRDGKGILECKTTQTDVDPDDIPRHWFCQLQYQLGVTGLRRGALAWLTRGVKFGYVWIEFDEDFYGYLCEQLGAFWGDCVIGGHEPELKTVSDVVLKFPRSTDKVATCDSRIMMDILALRSIKPQLEVLTEQKKEHEDAIKAYMADASVLSVGGCMDVLATWRSSKDSRKFDEKRFAEEHPELWAKYLKTVPGTRRLIVKN